MFTDKTLWLIGANSDISSCFAKNYCNKFGHVVLASKNIENTQKMQRENSLTNTSIFYIDLTDIQSIETFMSQAPKPFGVIFFAGFTDYIDKSENNSDSNIINTVAVNYLSPMIMIEKISKEMRDKGNGFVALLSSAGEIRGKYSNRFYVSSKCAITAYLEGIMQKNEKHSVKTMIFKMGHIDTKMLKKLGKSRKPLFVASPDIASEFLFKHIQKQKSTIKYFRPIWKLLAAVYKALPLQLYKQLDI